MVTIQVEVPEIVAKKFDGVDVVKYDDILDFDDNLKYSFVDEKVSFEELSNFLEKVISDKKSVC